MRKVYGDTPAGNQSRCDTCANAHIRSKSAGHIAGFVLLSDVEKEHVDEVEEQPLEDPAASANE